MHCYWFTSYDSTISYPAHSRIHRNNCLVAALMEFDLFEASTLAEVVDLELINESVSGPFRI